MCIKNKKTDSSPRPRLLYNSSVTAALAARGDAAVTAATGGLAASLAGTRVCACRHTSKCLGSFQLVITCARHWCIGFGACTKSFELAHSRCVFFKAAEKHLNCSCKAEADQLKLSRGFSESTDSVASGSLGELSIPVSVLPSISYVRCVTYSFYFESRPNANHCREEYANQRTERAEVRRQKSIADTNLVYDQKTSNSG